MREQDWERCTSCDCGGHVFDGDLPHTTIGCPLCGTCEVCADCDYDGPDVGCWKHPASPAVAKRMRLTADHNRRLMERLTGKYARSVPPGDVGHGPHA